ncbi:MAG: ABC transporter ATP-binding protein [Thermoplasmata archaeon]|uniref:ABC transporter ATP-binding protein n=1 Tax=Candidatus Sysuiplasma superficiale TaxID=2823368 RepID=A0A8J8CBZ8_9ARCH|nr:ABC transporter ATP-binding protein [Candidatus Sysuiplasma superficiale]
MNEETLLSIEKLSISYNSPSGKVRALNSVSLDIRKGEVLGIVGETGCGKSTLGHSIPRLLPEPPSSVDAGKIIFDGVDLLSLKKKEMPFYRGTGIAMIFQEPINSLNPSFRIYDQIAEAVKLRKLREQGRNLPSDLRPFRYDGTEAHGDVQNPMKTAFLPSSRIGRTKGFGDNELRDEVIEFLSTVRINDPERILRLYPHELSGGMRQRVMIAMALSEKPKLIVADEPTSALDVTIQAQVLSLMKDLIKKINTSILFISHDLGVIAEIADRIGVMYAGNLVEIGTADDVFNNPCHPYTRSLLRSFPHGYKCDGKLPTIRGSVPSLIKLPSGCPFNPRCESCLEECMHSNPGLVDLGNGHLVSCHLYDGEEA